ncbi:hypothetical protein [Paenibacillus faecalis]|uniref:hypothetical protein n=1 Tax=Paenibacillus faecalis TaxID=2079532 RepID=UPI00131A561A|nr:hypothetical protein [Paenibacillus faecalis]
MTRNQVTWLLLALSFAVSIFLPYPRYDGAFQMIGVLGAIASVFMMIRHKNT